MSKPFHVIATPDENGYTVTIPEKQRNRTNRTGMKKPLSVRNAERHIQVIRQCRGQTTKRKSDRNAEPVKRWTLTGLTKQNRT